MTVSTLVIIMVVLVITFFTGSEIEQRVVNRLPNTNDFYTTSDVCVLILPGLYERLLSNESTLLSNTTTLKNITNVTALEVAIKRTTQPQQQSNSSKSRLLPPLVAKTYASSSLIQKNNNATIFAHCGDCGSCSNPHDIAIYAATRDTLLGISTDCAKHGLVGGRRAASACMVTKVGLTPGCNRCWVDNIMCDLRWCLFSCLWHRTINKLFQEWGGGGQNKKRNRTNVQPLNACTTCDEKRCGPAFITCAGVNRRRAGILSDISRQNSEVCQLPDPTWWQSPFLQAYYEATQPAPSPGSYQWPFLRG